MMKKFLIPIVLLTVIACNNSSDDEKTTNDTLTLSGEQGTGSKALLADNAFARFLSTADSSYSIEKFESTGSHPLPGMESPLDTASIAGYRNLLVFNHDQTRAVDLFSYGTMLEGKKVEGGEPDSEAALLDFTSKKRIRLLYFGPSYGFTDAAFENNNIIIGGYERISDEKWRPMFWVIDLGANSVETFEYQDTLAVPFNRFFEQRYPDYRFF